MEPHSAMVYFLIASIGWDPLGFIKNRKKQMRRPAGTIIRIAQRTRQVNFGVILAAKYYRDWLFWLWVIAS